MESLHTTIWLKMQKHILIPYVHKTVPVMLPFAPCAAIAPQVIPVSVDNFKYTVLPIHSRPV